MRDASALLTLLSFFLCW